LRNIEWFVSNFSKKNNIRYKVNNKMFNVYDSYKNEQLKSYSKKHFDLYRRTNKFLIKITDKRSLETTVAQLNFFKWVMENDILDYVEKHHLDIKKEMVSKNHKKVKHIKGNTISISRNKIIIRFE
jgi:ribosomal protein L9